MEKICITSYVFGSYQMFIPVFVYSALKANKDSSIPYVKVYLDEPIQPSVKKSLEFLRSKGIEEFDIIEKLGYPDVNEVSHSLKVDPRTFYRFMTPLDEFSNFDYVFVADVDTYFLRETPSMLEYHKNKMKQYNYPISNCVRVLEDGTHTRRLTGFHVFKVDEYTQVFSDHINRLFGSSIELTNFFKGLVWDEEALFDLVDLEYDIDVFKRDSCTRPWHGLHLGAASKHKINSEHKERYYNAKAISNLDMTKSIEKELEDEIVVQLLKIIPLRSFFNFLRFFSIKPKSLKLRNHMLGFTIKSKIKELLGK